MSRSAKLLAALMCLFGTLASCLNDSRANPELDVVATMKRFGTAAEAGKVGDEGRELLDALFDGRHFDSYRRLLRFERARTNIHTSESGAPGVLVLESNAGALVEILFGDDVQIGAEEENTNIAKRERVRRECVIVYDENSLPLVRRGHAYVAPAGWGPMAGKSNVLVVDAFYRNAALHLELPSVEGDLQSVQRMVSGLLTRWVAFAEVADQWIWRWLRER